jgi:hypothetical protein
MHMIALLSIGPALPVATASVSQEPPEFLRHVEEAGDEGFPDDDAEGPPDFLRHDGLVRPPTHEGPPHVLRHDDLLAAEWPTEPSWAIEPKMPIDLADADEFASPGEGHARADADLHSRSGVDLFADLDAHTNPRASPQSDTHAPRAYTDPAQMTAATAPAVTTLWHEGEAEWTGTREYVSPEPARRGSSPPPEEFGDQEAPAVRSRAASISLVAFDEQVRAAADDFGDDTNDEFSGFGMDDDIDLALASRSL